MRPASPQSSMRRWRMISSSRVFTTPVVAKVWVLPVSDSMRLAYSVYLNFPADYLECIMMIPQAEIDNNPNITAADQNPYVQS